MLLYGAGLRIQDCLALRVKDLDFDQHQIVVRRGKRQKDRLTMLPTAVRERLQAHLREVKQQHDRDLAKGMGRVVLPFALDRKYPKASTDWAWQFVFPAARICRDPRWGPPSRYHLHESAVQKAVLSRTARARWSAPAATVAHWPSLSPCAAVMRPAFCSRSGTLALSSDSTIIASRPPAPRRRVAVRTAMATPAACDAASASATGRHQAQSAIVHGSLSGNVSAEPRRVRSSAGADGSSACWAAVHSRFCHELGVDADA